MAEFSNFWTTSGTGDGGDTLSEGQLTDWLRATHTTDRHVSEGVIAGVGGSLAVSGSSSPLSVAAGSAYVMGFYYQNSSALSVSVSTPDATTGHRVVLRVNYSANTVRVALLSSSDGTSSAPAVTQNSGTVWEIPLASLTITSAGVVTLTDERDYCRFALAPVWKRRGGSSSAWSTAGTTNYNAGGVLRQCGVTTLVWDDDESSDEKTVTFPRAYSAAPIVTVVPISAGSSTKRRLLASVVSTSTTSCKLRGYDVADDDDLDATLDVMWTAIGPE